MINISCVHTGASPSIIEKLESEFARLMRVPYRVSHHTAPEMIAEVSNAGSVTTNAAKRLIHTYALCAINGSDIILNVCSSVGIVAESAKSLFDLAGVKILRIDEAMCRQVVMKHKRIGMMGTLESTLAPSIDLLQRCAVDADQQIEIIPILAKGGFNKSKEELCELLVHVAKEHSDKLDGLILAQASMSFFEDEISQNIQKPVYSSPCFAAREAADVAKSLFENKK